MDKYEYRLRSEKIVELIESEKYEEAANIADTIDWRRVKSLTMLLKVAALYRINRRQEDSRAILLFAYDRYPSNRSVVNALCEVSIELDDVVAAIEYYKEFVKLAPRDNGVFTLRYKILEAQEASLEERIELLEEFKKRDYQEEWAYELAYLYHRVGLATKCIEECDDLILWFGDGPYVLKAMELKMLHAPLTTIQEKNYRIMIGEPVDLQDEEACQVEQTLYEPEEEYYGESYRDEEIIEETPEEASSDVYRDTASEDLSQYNTINLQKVVAESMRELFPDDNDIYEENKRDVERLESQSGKIDSLEEEKEDAVPVAIPVNPLEEQIEESEEKPEEVGEILQDISKENMIEQLISGVSEVEPDENAGAISKVIIPGVDQETIKQEIIKEYDYVPEYESVKSEEEEVPFRPMTGQINLEDVLLEWERLKKENEEKRKAEVKKLVLQQTGQLFEHFEQEIKEGALGAINNPDAEFPVYKVETIFEEEETPEAESQNEVKYEELDKEPESYTEEVAYEEEASTFEELEEEPENYTEEVAYEEEASTFEELEEEPEGFTEEVAYEEETSTFEELEEEPESFAEEAYYEEEDSAMHTQEISMNTEEISTLHEKIIETTKKETKGVKKEIIREFSEEEKQLFDDFVVTKKIKKQLLNTIENMTLASYTGNVLITGEAGLGTIRLSKNLIKNYKQMDANFSGKVAKITGEQLNLREVKDVIDKLPDGALIIEAANGMNEHTLYQLATQLNREDYGIIVFLVDTKKGIRKLLEKQTMIADYFNCRIDLMEMDNNALVAYAKSYAMALEYSIDELGTLALYTRIANIQSGNHVVTKDEVREIVDEAIYNSKKPKLKNLVDVIFSRRYDSEDMIVLKERDFM